MSKFTNNFSLIFGGILAGLLGVLSLGFDVYPQFPSMCMILGVVLFILINTLDPIPKSKRHDWHTLYHDVQIKKISPMRALLYLHAKIVFPTLFTIYLLLLIIEKVKIVPPDWHYFAHAAIDTLKLLWVTLGSAVLANFTGCADDAYEIDHDSPFVNSLTLVLICLLSYGGMWAIFVEIASIGRVAYFVSLGVGILIALVSCMILTEEEQEQEKVQGWNDRKIEIEKEGG